jgi:hypothetical protein
MQATRIPLSANGGFAFNCNGSIPVWYYGYALRFCPATDATTLEVLVAETVATTGATFSVAAALAGVERLAAAVVVTVVDGKATSAFPDQASKSDWDQSVQQEALVPAPWYGTHAVEFFGWQERAAGADSSRDKE